MNYNKHYNNIITKAKSRIMNGYVEKHHILPKCLGGTDDVNNLVILTPEEHYLAHLLLVKIYPNNSSLIYAARMMCVGSKNHSRNNKMYGWLKKEYSKVEKKPRKKPVFTKPRKERKKETKPRKKRILSEEHKLKIGQSGKGIKHSHSKESLEKIIETNKRTKTGVKFRVIQCPHCSVKGGINIMHLHHFDNCKVNLQINL